MRIGRQAAGRIIPSVSRRVPLAFVRSLPSRCICLLHSLRNFIANARTLCLLGHDCNVCLCACVCPTATCEFCCLLSLWLTVVWTISRGQLIDLSFYMYIVLKGCIINFSQYKVIVRLKTTTSAVGVRCKMSSVV